MTRRELFSFNICYLRSVNKLTQGQVAKGIGATRNAVCAWEAQQATPLLTKNYKFKPFLGHTLIYLLTYNVKTKRKVFKDLPSDDVLKSTRTHLEDTRANIKKIYSHTDSVRVKQIVKKAIEDIDKSINNLKIEK